MSDVAQLQEALKIAHARIAELEAQVPPPPAPVNVDVPLVMGVGAVGQTLECTMGNWQGEPSAYGYVWASNGSPISATGNTYVVVPGDVGAAISCVVTATNAGGSTTAPRSNEILIEDQVALEEARRRP